MMFRNYLCLVFVALFVCDGLAEAADRSEPPRPNIVLIMADDMGFSDLGCYGSEISTPTIDRLAYNGLRFTQFYNTARCCPTRAALLTGLYQHQAGIGHMVGDYGFPSYRGFLNDRCVTIAEALGLAGYRTLMSGKWHVGERRPHWPTDRGFDRYYGLISGASNYFKIESNRQMAIDDRPFIPEGDDFYTTDAFSDNAAKFIEKYGPEDKPFFLYVAYTAPHWPLHAWPEDIAKYRGKYLCGWDELRQRRHKRMIEMGIVDARWPMTPRDERVSAWADVDEKSRDVADSKMAVYAAQIDRMDQGIAKIVAQIERIGELDNTLIMFFIDNGGCAENINRSKRGAPVGRWDSFMSYGVHWANASNTPFRLYKHWVHEGGISTPLVVHWPAVIKKQRITRQAGHLIDIMATCLNVADADYPKTYKGREIIPFEGKSLLPVFRGKELPQRPIFWEHEGNRAVRLGKWKLVSRYPGDWELYDIEADRTEMNNLAGKYPDRVKDMAAMYEQWADRCGVVPWKKITEINKQRKMQKKKQGKKPGKKKKAGGK